MTINEVKIEFNRILTLADGRQATSAWAVAEDSVEGSSFPKGTSFKLFSTGLVWDKEDYSLLTDDEVVLIFSRLTGHHLYLD